jgi:hypothetical protein
VGKRADLHGGYGGGMRLGGVKVYGVGGLPGNMIIDGGVYGIYEYNEMFNSLSVQFFVRKMNSDKAVELSWSF